MKTATQSKLNYVASHLVAVLVSDIEFGHTTKSEVESDRSSHNCPSDIEFIKMTIRKDKANIESAMGDFSVGCRISNVVKTSYQLNYLANEIVYRLRSSKLRSFKNAVGLLFKGRKAA